MEGRASGAASAPSSPKGKRRTSVRPLHGDSPRSKKGLAQATLMPYTRTDASEKLLGKCLREVTVNIQRTLRRGRKGYNKIGDVTAPSESLSVAHQVLNPVCAARAEEFGAAGVPAITA